MYNCNPEIKCTHSFLDFERQIAIKLKWAQNGKTLYSASQTLSRWDTPRVAAQELRKLAEQIEKSVGPVPERENDAN